MLARLLLASDAYLLGLTAVVGFVTYPGFALVGHEQWAAFHAHHTRAITLAVGPAWLLQGVTSLWWLIADGHQLAPWIHGAVVFAAVVATVIGAVPQHEKLARSESRTHLTRLQAWHVVRSVCWLLAVIVTVAAA
jgi:hypothetical protein